ncbi:hypothetical protein SAMN05660485_03259 [Blastococcus fimeti]|nr:hypothetical protein SAMN05660485_03259 [Blastococcus fimeti]
MCLGAVHRIALRPGRGVRVGSSVSAAGADVLRREHRPIGVEGTS